MTTNKFYVYQLIDPRSNAPFYVGKGTGRRAYKHLYETYDNTTNRHRLKIINDIRKDGQEPIIDIIISDIPEHEALNIEYNTITHYGKICNGSGCLTNIADGGAQPPKGTGNPEWKTNNPSTKTKGLTYEERYGIERSKIIKENRSMSLTGRTFSSDTLKQMSESAKNRTDRRYQSKRIKTPDDTFDQMTDAALYYNVSRGTITHRVNSTHPRWDGWEYST
jgi:hypothetical protein